MVLRVWPIPTRFSTNILYTLHTLAKKCKMMPEKLGPLRQARGWAVVDYSHANHTLKPHSNSELCPRVIPIS